MIGKLLGLVSLGETLSSLNLARKFVAELTIIIIITIVGAMLTGALSVAALWECHQFLMHRGLDPDVAALITFLLGLGALGALAAVVVYKINRIRSFPLSLGKSGFPVETIHSIVRGFYQGLTRKD